MIWKIAWLPCDPLKDKNQVFNTCILPTLRFKVEMEQTRVLDFELGSWQIQIFPDLIGLNRICLGPGSRRGWSWSSECSFKPFRSEYQIWTMIERLEPTSQTLRQFVENERERKKVEKDEWDERTQRKKSENERKTKFVTTMRRKEMVKRKKDKKEERKIVLHFCSLGLFYIRSCSELWHPYHASALSCSISLSLALALSLSLSLSLCALSLPGLTLSSQNSKFVQNPFWVCWTKFKI